MKRKLKRFKVVGWYSVNPLDEHVRPHARVIIVKAPNATVAFSTGLDVLDALAGRRKFSMLNWYVEKVKAK
jgi:hypothetical protein